jgi:hypothetical protein
MVPGRTCKKKKVKKKKKKRRSYEWQRCREDRAVREWGME